MMCPATMLLYWENDNWHYQLKNKNDQKNNEETKNNKLRISLSL